MPVKNAIKYRYCYFNMYVKNTSSNFWEFGGLPNHFNKTYLRYQYINKYLF